MIIVWRSQADRDVHRIFDLVLEHDPEAAVRLCDRIERRIGQLRDHSYLGRPGRVGGTRELVVAGTPYIVAYRVAGAQIDILCFMPPAAGQQLSRSVVPSI
jgi:addiction module RelE/StbE family toxin